MELRKNQPDLNERKTFWRWAYARDCFDQVTSTCQFLSAPPYHLSETIKEALVCSVVVTYSKPFTRWKGLNVFAPEIPHEFQTLHAHLIDLRDKYFAHCDGLNFEAETPSGYGNITRVTLKVTPDQWNLSIMKVRGDYEISNIQALSRKLFEKADYHIDKFINKYLKKPLRPGEYLVNIDPKDVRPFVPISVST